MPSGLLHALDSAVEHFPGLLWALVLSQGLAILTSGHFCAVPIFMMQRFIVISLLWSSTDQRLLQAMAIGTAAISLIYALAWVQRRLTRVVRPPAGDRTPLSTTPYLRAEVAALGLVASRLLAESAYLFWLPPAAALACVPPFVGGLLALLVSPSALQLGLATLSISDSARVIYALGGPEALPWGVWLTAEVVVALASTYRYSGGRRRLPLMHKEPALAREDGPEIPRTAEERA